MLFFFPHSRRRRNPRVSGISPRAIARADDLPAHSASLAQIGAVGKVARHQLGSVPNQLGKGNGMKVQMSRWKGMDEDISDDQQDIARGRGMVDSKFQGGFGLGGTQVRTLSAFFHPRLASDPRGATARARLRAPVAHFRTANSSPASWKWINRDSCHDRSRSTERAIDRAALPAVAPAIAPPR